MAKTSGRRKGGHNKGYFFRKGRGWFTLNEKTFVPLTDEAGERLRDEHDEETVKLAYARYLLDRPAEPEVQDLLPDIADAQVGEVCAKYLASIKPKEKLGPNPTGSAKTFRDRGQTLYDFCYGLPGEFFCDGDLEVRARILKERDPESKRVHVGFGGLLCSQLLPTHIDTWLQSHNWKPGGYRTRVQAVKRALNFAVERKMIPASPIVGYKIPKSVSRVTYLTPDQEKAMLGVVSPSFAIALQVCIRTGARFGCEFANLTAEHIRDHGDRLELVFKADESKTKKQRIVRIMDADTIARIRAQMQEHRSGPIFRSKSGEPWTRAMLSQNFRRAKAKLKLEGIELDRDACMYSCRHTYAKRTLEGYWCGKPASITTLARLMGNSVKVCMDHYLQFSNADNEMLWDVA